MEMSHHQPLRSREELHTEIERWDAITVHEPELRGVFDLRKAESLLDDFVFREASLRPDDRIEVADIRLRGVLRDLSSHTRTLLEMVRAPEMIDFMRVVLGERRYVEGAQIHRMPTGAHLPAHRHGDDDVFAIFHFAHDYQGGAYFEERNGDVSYPVIPPYSLFISRGVITHGVEPITAGERIVLVTCWTPSSYKC